MGDSAAISNFNIKGKFHFNPIFCALKNYYVFFLFLSSIVVMSGPMIVLHLSDKMGVLLRAPVAIVSAVF